MTFRDAQDRMRHVPEPVEQPAPLPAGDEGPLNDQGSTDFNVGGVERSLTREQQLEQLVSYMNATYPAPDTTPPWAGGAGDPADADRYMALLPDRITHAAMLMLGSALDHTMPGVAYGTKIAKTRDLPALSDIPDTPGEPVIPARIFVPEERSGRWAVSLHPGGFWRGSGAALEMRWRPEVAAAAHLSGTTILDLDYPLAPEHDVAEMVAHVRRTLDYVRAQNPTSVTLWGCSAGGALAALCADSVDALVLTYPSQEIPEPIAAGMELPAPDAWPRTLMQIALQDDVLDYDVPDAEHVEVAEYYSTHTIATPAELRRRVEDVAEFLASVNPA